MGVVQDREEFQMNIKCKVNYHLEGTQFYSGHLPSGYIGNRRATESGTANAIILGFRDSMAICLIQGHGIYQIFTSDIEIDESLYFD
jgi:hypothetical protein